MAIAIAYCWASGEIEISEETDDFELPEGVIEFARGEAGELAHRIDMRARHAYEPGLFLVPGLPEYDEHEDAAIQIKRVTILESWVNWAFSDWPIGHDHIRTQPVIAEE